MHPCRVKGEGEGEGGGVGDGKRVTHVPGPYRRVHIRRAAGETDREKAGRPRKKSKIPRIQAGLLWIRSYAEAVRGIRVYTPLNTTTDPQIAFFFLSLLFLYFLFFFFTWFHPNLASFSMSFVSPRCVVDRFAITRQMHVRR